MPITYTSGEQVEVYRFSIPVTIGVPLLALFVQAFLPLRFPRFAVYFDLPLLVTIFFAMARRSPVAGLFTGAVIGLAQDMLGHNPIGIYGIAKTVVGYGASSLGVKLDVENAGARLLVTLGLLPGAFGGLFHRGARNGEHDPDLELAPRHSGRRRQCDPRRGAVLPARQVQAENVNAVPGTQYSVFSSRMQTWTVTFVIPRFTAATS